MIKLFGWKVPWKMLPSVGRHNSLLSSYSLRRLRHCVTALQSFLYDDTLSQCLIYRMQRAFRKVNIKIIYRPQTPTVEIRRINSWSLVASVSILRRARGIGNVDVHSVEESIFIQRRRQVAQFVRHIKCNLDVNVTNDIHHRAPASKLLNCYNNCDSEMQPAVNNSNKFNHSTFEVY